MVWSVCSLLSQHWVCLQLQPNILVDQLCMQVEPTDSSYMPSSVMVVGGNIYGNLQSIQKTVAIPPTSHNMYLLTNQTEVGGVHVGGNPILTTCLTHTPHLSHPHTSLAPHTHLTCPTL